MPIKENAGFSGKRISEPGEYRVAVHEVIIGKTKLKEGQTEADRKSLLTIVFQTRDGRQIKGWYAKGVNHQMKALQLLKIAAGCKENAQADELLGKELGILVKQQEPDDTGRIWTQITGYGPAHEVTESQGSDELAPVFDDTEVPF